MSKINFIEFFLLFWLYYLTFDEGPTLELY